VEAEAVMTTLLHHGITLNLLHRSIRGFLP